MSSNDTLIIRNKNKQSNTEFTFNLTDTLELEESNYIGLDYCEFPASLGFSESTETIHQALGFRWGSNSCTPVYSRSERPVIDFEQPPWLEKYQIFSTKWVTDGWKSNPKVHLPLYGQEIMDNDKIKRSVQSNLKNPWPDPCLKWQAFMYLDLPKGICFTSLEDVKHFLYREPVLLTFLDPHYRYSWFLKTYGKPPSNAFGSEPVLVMLEDYIDMQSFQGSLKFRLRHGNFLDADLCEIRAHPEFTQLQFPYNVTPVSLYGPNTWYPDTEHSYQLFDVDGDLLPAQDGPLMTLKHGIWPRETNPIKSGFFIHLSCTNVEEFVPYRWLLSQNKENSAVLKYEPYHKIMRKVNTTNIRSIQVRLTNSKGQLIPSHSASGVNTLIKLSIY